MAFAADSRMVIIISISLNRKGHFENKCMKILKNWLLPTKKALELNSCS